MNKKDRPSLGIRLLTFLLALVLCLGTLAAIMVANVRIVTTKENLQKIISQALFTSHRVTAIHGTGTGGSAAPSVHTGTRLSRARLNGSVTVPEDVTQDGQALLAWVYDTLMEEYGEELEIAQEDVEAFLEESTLKEFVAEMSASLISDFYTGENTTTLDADTIRQLLEENAPLIEKHFGYTMDPEVIDVITASIEANDLLSQIREEGVMGILTGGGTTGGDSDVTIGDAQSPEDDPMAMVTQVLESFRAATSSAALVGCIVLVVVCGVLIVVLNRRYIWRALRAIGNGLLFGALPAVLLTVLALAAADLWNTLFSEIPVVGKVIHVIASMTAPVGISVLVVGVALDIAALVVRIRSRKAASTAAETEYLSQSLEPRIPEPQAQEPVSETEELSQALTEEEPAAQQP